MMTQTELLVKINKLQSYSLRAYVIAVLLNRSNGRISEIISIKRSDEIDLDLYLIIGKKGSNNYTLFAPELKLLNKTTDINTNSFFDGYNVSTVYRAFVKFGIKMHKENRKNNSVTHTFRNLRARLVSQKFNSEDITKDVLHHKSKSSQKHYL